MTRKRTSTDKSTTTTSTTPNESDDAPAVDEPIKYTCKSGQILTEGRWSGIPHFTCPRCKADILKKPWEIECKPTLMVDTDHHTQEMNDD